MIDDSRLNSRDLSETIRVLLLSSTLGGTLIARVAKLADALDLGSCALNGVGVQLPPLAP
jgi:hypothetical protein